MYSVYLYQQNICIGGIKVTDFCEYKAFFDEAISFYKSAQIIQDSDFRIRYDETDVFGPIVYLFRHAAELLFKSLIIKKLFETGVSDWQSVKLKSNKRRLSSTHSLYELYVAWMDFGGDVGLTQEEKDMIKEYVNNINRFDKDSTFFRYPINKKGNRNKKALTEELDEELLNSLPCHLGALVYAKGPENFSCLHREQFMENLEFDLDNLIKMLVEIFNND